MAETLLQYLTKRNPTVTASSVGTSNFTYSQDWENVEDLAVWTEFTYETLVSRFGEDLRREVPRFDATANSEQGGYNRIYNERGLTDLVCQSIMGPVSAVLGPLFITSSGRVMENLGCDPDWGAGHEGSSNANGRSKALILGDTKYKWSSTSAINTVRNKVDGSYEDSPTRDAVRPLEQVMYYGSLYKCRYAFIITEKELLVVRLHLAPDPIRTSPRPVRTRHPPSPHQRTLSSSTISRQFSDMSINESDLRPRIGLLKYKSIAWSANSGLTVKLALYLLTRLAHVDGSDLRHDYPPLASSVALSPSPSVPGNLHTDKGKGKEAMGIVTPSETSSKRKADPQIQPNQVSTKKSRDQLDRPRTDKSGYIDVKVHWNKERTGYNYAVGDPKVPDNYIINDPAVNWREIVEGKIYNFTREPYLRSDKP